MTKKKPAAKKKAKKKRATPLSKLAARVRCLEATQHTDSYIRGKLSDLTDEIRALDDRLARTDHRILTYENQLDAVQRQLELFSKGGQALTNAMRETAEKLAPLAAMVDRHSDLLEELRTMLKAMFAPAGGIQSANDEQRPDASGAAEPAGVASEGVRPSGPDD